MAESCHLCVTRQCTRGYTATCRKCRAALPRPISRALDRAWTDYSKAWPTEPARTAEARKRYEQALAAAEAAIAAQEHAR